MTTDRWLGAWAIGSVALGAASLLVPLYYVTLGGDAVGLGLLAGVGAAAGAPGAILAGRFVDRTGRRRPVVLAALAVVAAVMATVPLVRNPGVLVLANGVLWFASGAAAPVLTLLVTVGHEERAWSDRFARLNVAGGWGWAGGLVLGTIWTGIGALLGSTAFVQRTLFVVCAVAGIVGVLAASAWLPREPTGTDRPRPAAIAKSIARARRPGLRSATFPVGPGRLFWLTRSMDPRRFARRVSPAFATYFLAVAATFLGFGVFWGPLPLYLRDLGVASGSIFAFYLASSLGSAVCYGLAGRLANRQDPTGLNGAALLGRSVLQPAVAGVALLATGTVAGLLVTGVGFLLVGVVWAVIAVTATVIVTALSSAAVRGQALGLYTAVSGLANGVGAVFGGWLAAWDFVVTFVVSGGFVLCGAVVVVALWRRERRNTQSGGESLAG